MRAFDRPGRSAVHASHGMVATSHPLACSSALAILREGGNAVDAAIAASAVLSVVEPQMTGIGGDCFCILAEPDGSLHGLNGSGRAAANATLDWYRQQGIHSLAEHPAHAVTVPGSVKAWETLLERFGTLGFDRLFADAIDYAENGFVLAPRVACDWQLTRDKLRQNDGARRHYLRDGQAPAVGEKFRLPALANTLKAIARSGSAAMYTGRIAADIASTVQALGGFLSEEDLANVSADWVELISTHYRGVELFEIPPNGQGITALILLNLLNKLQAANLSADSAQRIHLEMECARLAYSVRDACVSDPQTMQANIDGLLSDEFANALAESFNPAQRKPDISLPAIPQADTVYLTVVDRDLRAVSFINSIYMSFGSGIVTTDSGVVLQNRGACFSLEENHPNAIGPSKRPMHTIIPAMAMKNGKVEYSFGVMGGAYQAMGHAHVLTNLVDYGMDPQEALDHPRVFWGDDGTLEFESATTAATLEALSKLGHQVRYAGTPHGGGQIIQIDHAAGVLIGGSDPRKDGQVQGY
ncbi:MAG: gamma-glutamyltransferase [Gammaproteobacteria bacterium]|nr:gamma-glutamyltransferase [Gammaproteobacteria bacterium]